MGRIAAPSDEENRRSWPKDTEDIDKKSTISVIYIFHRKI